MEKVTGTSTWRGWSLVAVVTCEQTNVTLVVANTPTESFTCWTLRDQDHLLQL